MHQLSSFIHFRQKSRMPLDRFTTKRKNMELAGIYITHDYS